MEKFPEKRDDLVNVAGPFDVIGIFHVEGLDKVGELSVRIRRIEGVMRVITQVAYRP